MKKPRVEDFDPKARKRKIKPEEVDFSGAPEIKEHPSKSSTPSKKTKGEKDSERSFERTNEQPSPTDKDIENIRKVVKRTGKEIAYIRCTPEEKDHLVKLLYTLKGQGFKTSENEVLRIAVNVLLEDYSENGGQSKVIRLLKLLQA